MMAFKCLDKNVLIMKVQYALIPVGQTYVTMPAAIDYGRVGEFMPIVNRSALVPFSAENMFDLVNDVVQYPSFLPGCVDANVLEQTCEHMKASLLIKKAGVNQWFTTSNELSRGKFINMSLVEGPFKSLQGGWHFTALAEDACKIEFRLEFEFSSKLVEMAFGKVFSSIANNMVKSFTDRAKDVCRG